MSRPAAAQHAPAPAGPFPRAWLAWGVPLLMAPVLVAMSRQSYLLFHSAVEIFTVIVGVMIFVIGVGSYRFHHSHYVCYLGAGYLWISLVDLVHALAYKGMGVFPGFDADLPTQLWVTARYLEAALLLSAPLLLTRAVRPLTAVAGWAVPAALALLAISQGRFPEAYATTGLTTFKVASEYVIIVLLALAIGHLLLRRRLLDRRTLSLVIAAVVTTMLAEFAFTRYGSVYGDANLVGHLLKFSSFWLLFLAFVQTELADPLDLLSRLAATYAGLPDPALLLNEHRIVVEANPASAELLGLGLDELVGSDIDALLVDALDATMAQRLAEALHAGESAAGIVVQGRSTRATYLASVTPLGLPGRSDLTVLVLRDVSTLNEQEERLEQQAQRLRQSNEDLMDLTRLAAHELREPLRSVAGQLGLLDRHLAEGLGKEDRLILYDAVAGARRMSQMVDALQDFAGILSVPETQTQIIDTDRLVASVVAGVRRDRAASDATITVASPLPAVTGDPTLVAYVFQQLLTNALRNRSPDRPCAVWIRGRRVGPWAELSVVDNGVGIPASQRERVFELVGGRLWPWHEHEGAGLGLPSCKRIVTRYGGMIEAAANEHGGSTVSFTLPAYDPVAPHDTLTATSSTTGGGR